MRLIDADATIKYLREFRCKDCDRRKGMKNGKMRFIYEIGDAPCRACDIGDTIDYFLDEDISPTIDVLALLKEQEAETVIKIAKRFNDCDLTGYCPFCSRPLIKDWAENYCGYCGKPVLWEDR